MNIEYLIICITSFLISIITLFSGFGLGTVLMPVFAIFFPLSVAIASVAVVHLANNLFKAFLVGKYAKTSVVIKFGIPAALAAALGAYLLSFFSNWPPISSYHLNGLDFKITIIGIIVGSIVMFSSIFELVPRFSRLSFDQEYIPLGGAISGFFGGVSGNQGILRSAFLIKSGLSKEEFIGTGVLCSIIVDVIRILVYGWAVYTQKLTEPFSQNMIGIVTAACITAFLGSYIGSKLTHKITFRMLQLIVGSMLLILGFAITIGVA
ncbi:MAG: sulfite exporter TauE/SafE family protein [Parachlamydiaceae bacterium]|nr:sulfite exporter TauE/SafE family protein [Parachlamydiaceae bacterium]